MKFDVGQKVLLRGERHEIVTRPDSNGDIVLLTPRGQYRIVPWQSVSPIPPRFVVEIRSPRRGERYLANSQVYVAPADVITPYPVLVDEVWP